MTNPRQQLPAWYHRLVTITIKEDRDIYPQDFDEDISDLNDSGDVDEKEGEKVSISHESGCDADYCECESLNEDDEHVYDSDDKMSERSYNGSNAHYYYELKDEREERKRELQNIRELEQKAKKEQYAFKRNKKEEVQSAYESLKIRKEVKTISLDDIASKNFRLYSTDYVNHCYSLDYYPTKYIEFYHLKGNGSSPYSQPLLDGGEMQIEGHIYFNVDSGCNFRPFSPPTHASLDDYQLERMDGKYGLIVQFLSNDYLKLKVDHELVFIDRSQPQQVPEFFKFVGIRFNMEKERERRKAQARVERSPSPRESWFEMNHPMGSWNLP